MKEHRWFEYPGAFGRFNKKSIKAPVIILSDGEFEGRDGQIWVHKRGNTTKVAVTLVFSNNRKESTQFLFHLTRDQVDHIIPCVDGADFKYSGPFIPESLLIDEFP